jgi:poly(hydroxyalkanoate) depolymerase family esterase
LLVTALVGAAPAQAASLVKVSNFGTNPTNLQMYVYRPDNLPAHPGVLVAVHYCTGSGPALYSGTKFAALADQYKFIVIYPSSTNADKCFDVSSPAALKRNGGSDPVGILSMVNYAKQNYGVDANRIFVAGLSSGAMMTNVLLADYPDVFKAGSAFSGVPYTCFATGSASVRWNSECFGGRITKTAQAWGDLVRANNPGYSGPWPRVMLWHGTVDTTLSYVNIGEEIKQWTNVNGVSQTPTSTATIGAETRTKYANSSGQVRVEARSFAGYGHSIPIVEADAISFFGLDGTTTTPPTSPPVTTPPVTTPPATTPPPSTPPVGSAGCTAVYSTTDSWAEGFVGNVRVTAGSASITHWTVKLALPSGTAITGVWNGTLAGTQVTNASYNGALAAGAGTDFGFQGTGSPTGLAVTSCTAG